MAQIHTRRLASGDDELARELFAIMAEVFAEEHGVLSDGYLQALLGRDDFWAIAAFSGDELVGGVTAHALPMTRTEARELFIYDLAVREDYRRIGVGRSLIAALREAAAAQGIREIFVLADDDDAHALAFYRTLGGAPSPVTIFTFTGETE